MLLFAGNYKVKLPGSGGDSQRGSLRFWLAPFYATFLHLPPIFSLSSAYSCIYLFAIDDSSFCFNLKVLSNISGASLSAFLAISLSTLLNDPSFPDLHPCVLGLTWFLQLSYVCHLHICPAQFPLHLFLPLGWFFGVSRNGRRFSALSQWQYDMFLFNSGVASIHTVHLHFSGSSSCLSAFCYAWVLTCKTSQASHREKKCLGKCLFISFIHLFLLIFSSTRQLVKVCIKKTLDICQHLKCRQVFKAVVWHIGRDTCCFSWHELDVKSDTTPVCPICSWLA